MIHGIYVQDSWGDPGGWVDLMRLENRNGEHVNLGFGKEAESGCYMVYPIVLRVF